MVMENDVRRGHECQADVYPGCRGAACRGRPPCAGGVLWICCPNLTSTKAGGPSRRAVAQVALDDTWSAMRFVPEG